MSANGHMTNNLDEYSSSSDSESSGSSQGRHSTLINSPVENINNENRRTSREASRLVGTVKWFNAKAGYGFITRNDNQEDVFVHLSGIARKNPRHAFKSLCDGEIVEFNTIATNVTGLNGTNVIGNPYVATVQNEFAGGDSVSHRRRNTYSRIPRWEGYLSRSG
jgi:cold shock protein